MDLPETKEALAVTAAAAATVGTVWKGRKVATAIALYILNWFRMPVQVASMQTIISRELTPNGGGSIRDLVVATAALARGTEARSRTILSQLHIPFWESDADGRCLFYSRELSLLSGWQQQDVLGYGWISSIHPDDRELVQEEWTACMRDRREFVMDYDFISPTGTRIPVHAEALPMRDHRNDIIGYVGRVTRRAPVEPSAVV